jgi:ribosomal protein RSM22 (predicted rRNA methylase)
MDLPRDLREALDGALSGLPALEASAAVDRLIERYRLGGAADQPILGSAVDVAAYAAYRLPATYAAARSALAQAALAAPTLAPVTQLDVGGGSGAAAWAATAVFPSLATVTVLDQVAPVLELGQRIAAGAASAALRGAAWRGEEGFAKADLVTISYVLSELTEADQAAFVRRAAGVATMAVAVIEPGTPTGYVRVLAARDELIAAGLTVVAPCPHQARCPLPVGKDWCHFAARVNRSALHRRVKGAELSFEDEKFSYVVATRSPAGPTPARVLRRPQLRKGLVALQLCRPDGDTAAELVSKRQGERYRAARDVDWGDPWS